MIVVVDAAETTAVLVVKEKEGEKEKERNGRCAAARDIARRPLLDASRSRDGRATTAVVAETAELQVDYYSASAGGMDAVAEKPSLQCSDKDMKVRRYPEHASSEDAAVKVAGASLTRIPSIRLHGGRCDKDWCFPQPSRIARA